MCLMAVMPHGLCVAVYSREQIIKETEAMGKSAKPESAPW